MHIGGKLMRAVRKHSHLKKKEKFATKVEVV
jgi:hypothetical protein